jgi:hypothetical protein
MALEASHIRFALDIKAALGVTDIDAYVSGSVYPDSRYVTGMDRFATHPEGYRNDPAFRSNDFRKGWFAHLLCDDIQWKVMGEKVPRVCEGATGQGGESWVKRTAIKILQDIDDAKRFDLKNCLSALEYIENPNGEDTETMRRYNRIFIKMYADPNNVTIDDAYEMWREFGIGDELAAKVRARAQEYGADKTVMIAVKALYGEILSRALTDLRS